MKLKKPTKPKKPTLSNKNKKIKAILLSIEGSYKFVTESELEVFNLEIMKKLRENLIDKNSVGWPADDFDLSLTDEENLEYFQKNNFYEIPELVPGFYPYEFVYFDYGGLTLSDIISISEAAKQFSQGELIDGDILCEEYSEFFQYEVKPSSVEKSRIEEEFQEKMKIYNEKMLDYKNKLEEYLLAQKQEMINSIDREISEIR